MLIDGIYVNHKETVTGILSVTTPVIPSGLFQSVVLTYRLRLKQHDQALYIYSFILIYIQSQGYELY